MQPVYIAIGLLFRSPKLFLLCLLPGIVTIALSFYSARYIVTHLLASSSLWIIMPVSLLSFLTFWLFFSAIALAPFEDAIINNAQLVAFNKLKLPQRKFNFLRSTKTIFFAFCLAAVSLVLILLSFVPGLNYLYLAFAPLITSLSFLLPIYDRKNYSTKKILAAFFKNISTNYLLGFFLQVLLIIPFVNVFLSGFALVLATIYFLERDAGNETTLVDQRAK